MKLLYRKLYDYINQNNLLFKKEFTEGQLEIMKYDLDVLNKAFKRSEYVQVTTGSSGFKVDNINDSLRSLYKIHEYNPFVVSAFQAHSLIQAKLDTENINYFKDIKFPFDKIILETDEIIDIKGFRTKLFIIENKSDEVLLTTFSEKGVNLYQKTHFVKDRKSAVDFMENISKECLTVIVKKDGNYFTREEGLGTSLINFAVAFSLFINAENVIREEYKEKLKKGNYKSLPRKPQFCFVKKEIVKHTSSKTGKFRHNVRYDVRGHFRHFNCGEGRKERKIKWIEPHQRGLENEIYRPKIYKIV